MGAVAWMISRQGEWGQSGVSPEKVGLLLGAIAIAILIYGGASYLLGSEELHLAAEGMKRKVRSWRS
jgi:hypothetical protein